MTYLVTAYLYINLVVKESGKEKESWRTIPSALILKKGGTEYLIGANFESLTKVTYNRSSTFPLTSDEQTLLAKIIDIKASGSEIPSDLLRQYNAWMQSDRIKPILCDIS
jgi:hypothetical protein